MEGRKKDGRKMAPRHSELSMQLVARHHQESVRLAHKHARQSTLHYVLHSFFVTN